MAICSLFADSPIAIFYLKIRNFKALLGSLIITLEKGCFGLICSESKVGEGIVGLRTLSDGPLGLQGGSCLRLKAKMSKSENIDIGVPPLTRPNISNLSFCQNKV